MIGKSILHQTNIYSPSGHDSKYWQQILGVDSCRLHEGRRIGHRYSIQHIFLWLVMVLVFEMRPYEVVQAAKILRPSGAGITDMSHLIWYHIQRMYKTYSHRKELSPVLLIPPYSLVTTGPHDRFLGGSEDF